MEASVDPPPDDRAIDEMVTVHSTGNSERSATRFNRAVRGRFSIRVAAASVAGTMGHNSADYLAHAHRGSRGLALCRSRLVGRTDCGVRRHSTQEELLDRDYHMRERAHRLRRKAPPIKKWRSGKESMGPGLVRRPRGRASRTPEDQLSTSLPWRSVKATPCSWIHEACSAPPPVRVCWSPRRASSSRIVTGGVHVSVRSEPLQRNR